jgi:hypothetical protein
MDEIVTIDLYIMKSAFELQLPAKNRYASYATAKNPVR